MPDMASNYMVISIRYDGLTVMMIAACAAFLAWAGYVRGKTMKAKGPRQIRTYAERRNALRLATEQELISYGKAIGLRLMAVAANHKQNIANDRLIEMIAYANFLLLTEVNADAENATEQMMQYLDKVMGEDWEERADALCQKMVEEWRAAHG